MREGKRKAPPALGPFREVDLGLDDPDPSIPRYPVFRIPEPPLKELPMVRPNGNGWQPIHEGEPRRLPVAQERLREREDRYELLDPRRRVTE